MTKARRDRAAEPALTPLARNRSLRSRRLGGGIGGVPAAEPE